jgi:hypothetical protein
MASVKRRKRKNIDDHKVQRNHPEELKEIDQPHILSDGNRVENTDRSADKILQDISAADTKPDPMERNTFCLSKPDSSSSTPILTVPSITSGVEEAEIFSP